VELRKRPSVVEDRAAGGIRNRWSVTVSKHIFVSPMITDEIKELAQANPFRPIRIVLTDRQSFTVVHTDYLMVSPDRRTVLLYDKRNRFKIINAQQIKLVEPVESSGSGSAS
jgi:hypothetical protein